MPRYLVVIGVQTEVDIVENEEDSQMVVTIVLSIVQLIVQVGQYMVAGTTDKKMVIGQPMVIGMVQGDDVEG